MGTRTTTGRGPWLFQGVLIAALLVLAVGFGYLLASRGRGPAPAPATATATDSDEPTHDRRPDLRTAEPSPGSEAARLRRRSSASVAPAARGVAASDEPGAAAADRAAPATDEVDTPVKSLPAVEGLLTQLKDRARARHDVTVDEIDPGVRAIRQLQGQLSADEVIQKEGQFTREMAVLSRQFRAERGRSGNQPTGGTE